MCKDGAHEDGSCICLEGRGIGVTAVQGKDGDTGPSLLAVVATAVSARRTVMVEVNRTGFVCGVRLLSPIVRTWDSATLNDRMKAVAAVAHDRYHANARTDPDADELLAIAARERTLNF